MLTSAAIAAGIGLAAAALATAEPRPPMPCGEPARRLASINFRWGKFFIDEVYQVLLVWPGLAISRASDWIDQRIIDRLVNLVGRVSGGWVGPPPSAKRLIPFYAVGMVFGLLVLLAAVLMGWGWLGT